MTYYIISALLWFVLALVWKKKDVVNLTIKVVLTAMCVWSLMHVFAIYAK